MAVDRVDARAQPADAFMRNVLKTERGTALYRQRRQLIETLTRSARLG